MKKSKREHVDILKPAKLTKGDVVGICSPSGTIAQKHDQFERAARNFAKATGLSVSVAPNALCRHCYSAGTQKERLADFHALIKDNGIKAILFSAGGDTAIDLVQNIDYGLIRQYPKIVAGISDATTLLSAITAKTGLITFLGLEFLDFANHGMAYTVASIKKAWFEEKIGKIHANPAWQDLHKTFNRYKSWQTIRPGEAEGRLVGGNCESFLQLVGTEYELKFPDEILFLETYKLPKKQIHKALMQLKLRGVFDRVQGLIMGYCLECDNPNIVGNEQPITETVFEVVQDYNFPIMHIGEIGHSVENFLQPIGALAHLDATNLSLEILENVVT